MINNKGMSLLEVLVAVGVSSIVTLAAYYLLSSGHQAQFKSQALFWLTDMRSEVISSLKSKEGFKLTVLSDRNPSLACLKEKAINPVAKATCSSQGGIITTVLDKKGTVVINNSSLTSGFSAQGQVCNDFSETNPSDTCPFRYELSWRAICSQQNCSSPDVVLEGNLRVAFKRKDLVINPNMYNFSVFVSSEGEKNITTCEQSLLGAFDESASKCRLNLDVGCAAGQYVVGFDSSGRPNCSTVNVVRGSCTGDKRMRGVDSTGKAICVKWCR